MRNYLSHVPADIYLVFTLFIMIFENVYNDFFVFLCLFIIPIHENYRRSGEQSSERLAPLSTEGANQGPLKPLKHHCNILTRVLRGPYYAYKLDPLRQPDNKIPVWLGGENVFILLGKWLFVINKSIINISVLLFLFCFGKNFTVLRIGFRIRSEKRVSD